MEAMTLNPSGASRPDPFSPRNAPQARVRVTVDSQNGATILGHAVPCGTTDIIVSSADIESDGPRGKSLRSRVRTDEDRTQWEAAKARDKQAFELWQRENKAGTRLQYHGSPEVEFYRATGRGLRPIVKLEIVEDGLPPPETQESATERRIEMLVGKLAAPRAVEPKELIELRAKAAKADALESRLADLEARMAALVPPSSPTTKRS